MKLTTYGIKEWDKYYMWGQYGSNAYDIIENREGQYIFVGNNEFYYDNEALITVLDKTGQVQRKIELSPDYMDYVWSFGYITQTNDGGYFLGGGKNAVWNTYGKEIGTWFLKTDNEFTYR